MNISIGIYEFFAYTVPGAFFLLIALYGGVIFGWVEPELAWLEKAWLLALVVFVALSYVVGLLMYPVCLPWNKLFLVKGLNKQALEKAKQMRQEMELNISEREWLLLVSFLKDKNPDRAAEIERLNAFNLMLRSISFGLVLLAVVQTAYFIWISPVIWNLLFAAVFLGFSVVAGRQATRFARMYFGDTYLSILAMGLTIQDLVRPAGKTPIVSELTDIVSPDVTAEDHKKHPEDN